MIPLIVPFHQKDLVKVFGAKWDRNKKFWYVENLNDKITKEKLSDFIPLMHFPSLEFPINLIPSTAFYSNVRDHISESDWKNVRTNIYQKYNYQCQICGDKGDSHPVEAHEDWIYDDENKIQTLNKIWCLCPNCHQTQHLGLAELKGRLPKILSHYSKIMNISSVDAEKIAEESFEKWAERSKHEWSLDISWVMKNYKVTLIKSDRLINTI